MKQCNTNHSPKIGMTRLMKFIMLIDCNESNKAKKENDYLSPLKQFSPPSY